MSGAQGVAKRGVAKSGDGVRQRNGKMQKMQVKFTNSSAALLEDHTPSHQSTTQRYMASRASAALKLHRTRMQGVSKRLALCFLLALALLLAWSIGHFQASPALLALLAVASLFIGLGRWQQMVQGVELEAELRARHKSRSQVAGETVEWLNVALNQWWTTCDDSVLMFLKDHVEPLVKDILPSTVDQVEVVGVDLGGQTPSLSNVRLQDTPSTVGVASEGDNISTTVVNFDVTIPAPEAQIVLRAKIGGKSVGSSHLVYIESLYVSGRLQAVLVFDNRLPFPHLCKITGTFLSKPDIWFSVRVLKGLRVMEIPFLRNWIHSLVMDVFTTLLVDPGKLTFYLDPSQDPKECGSVAALAHSQAVGVLSVKVTGRQPPGTAVKGGAGGRVMTLRVGNKKYERALEVMGAWHNNYAFLVNRLDQELLVLKVKQRRLLYGHTLSVHSTSLASLGLVTESGEAIPDNRVVNYGSSEGQFSLQLKYTTLPPVSLSPASSQDKPHPQQTSSSGVLYIHVHDGCGLLAADSNGLSDPYCVVMANKQQVMRTEYISDTVNPTWESAVEVLVADLDQVVLKFVVYDYDGPVVGDDFLGVAKLPLSKTNPCQLRLSLPLRKKGEDSNATPTASLGSITVSVVFRPVASVAEASPACLVMGVAKDSQEEAVLGEGVALRRKSTKISGRKKKKKVQQSRGQQKVAMVKEESEEEGEVEPLMELQVLRGRDLVPKDSNGLSDPYVVVKYGSRVMFRSSVIKKTLNPDWNQCATLTGPGTEDPIHVECWDKDVFSDDFMGSMTFSHSDINSNFTNKPCWCKLQHVPHGELLLLLSVHQERVQSQEDERSEEVRWSHLDEASRQIVGQVPLREEPGMGGTVLMRQTGNGLEDKDGDEDSGSSSSSSHSGNRFSEAAVSHSSSQNGMTSNGSAPSFSPERTSQSSADLGKPPVLKRRHTLSHGAGLPSEIYKKYEESTDPSQLPRYPETTADINWALKQSSEVSGVTAGRAVVGTDRVSYKEKVHMVYHNLSGQIIEATGLKGNLDHMELYVKVRLNTRPSYQRQQKFARGPVVHKTRNLRGSHNPQWMEDFVVKENLVPSDSLLTLDLKSGSKVNIGTYVITLDKLFEGQTKFTRSLDIGNDMKLKLKMSRQLPVVQ